MTYLSTVFSHFQ